MNNADINLTASVDIVGVGGLGRIREEIRKEAAKGLTSPLGDRIPNRAADKRLAEFDRAVQLLGELGKGTTKDQLAAIRGARRSLNIATRQDFSTEAHKAVALLEESVNATSSVLRTQAKKEGVLASPDILRKIEAEQKQALAKENATALRASLNRSLKRMRDATGVWADGSTEDKSGEIAVMDYQLSQWRKSAADSRGGKLTDKQVKYFDSVKNELSDAKSSLKDINRNTKYTSQGIGSFLKLAGVGGVLASLGPMAQGWATGYYSSDRPFTTARENTAKALKAAGTAIGAGIGGAIGLALAPVTGGLSLLLAPLLGSAGHWLGGTYERDQAASNKVKGDATQMARFKGLFPSIGGGGWQFAKMAEEATGGIVTAGAIESMAATSQEFGAAMAFGGVSESQMLGMTMLPNYYASVMAGESPEKQIAALMDDVGGMDPGLAQYAARLAGVPAEMLALVRNPEMATRLLGEGAAVAQQVASGAEPYTGSLLRAQFRTGVENRRETLNQFARAAESISPFDYESNQSFWTRNKTASSAIDFLFGDKFGPMIKDAIGRENGTKDLVKRDLNIIIDNQQVATIKPVYTDADIGDYISYAAGNL